MMLEWENPSYPNIQILVQNIFLENLASFFFFFSESWLYLQVLTYTSSVKLHFLFSFFTDIILSL